MSQEPLHIQLGLTDDEADEIEKILGRKPNPLELSMYSVMWSEHCSYKSSRIHLKRLPTTAPHVLVGPGENAGVIDVGDSIAVAMRIESHNHPSAIEPYQGAATGIGGILRDIFTMGARPIALGDSLWFGELCDAKSRWIAEGVVSGVSGYGNSVGVPTVTGEITFDECYSANPLVNVFCLGVLPKSRLVLGQASGPGNLAVLLGSSTGRDGIGGVSVLASAPLDEDEAGESASKRPSVQVGDPFEEKRLIEACLELLDAGLVVGIQDLGGAGLTCATSETAARGGVGMDVDVRSVPRREKAMEPFEVMTSESQERMLAIVTPDNLARLQEVCNKWEINSAVVGKVVDPGSDPISGEPRAGVLRILDGWDGPVLAEVPAKSLADDAPLYDRPMSPPSDLAQRRAESADELSAPSGLADIEAELMKLVSDPSVGDAAWAYSQYDHQLFLNTVVAPGGDATVLKLKAPGLPSSTKGLSLSVDGNPRWCSIDPRLGTALVVAESVLNVACSGATPKALVNCLNFGNPTNPEVMWQLSESIDGMAWACEGFALPVIGGNVSLYNESNGVSIHPTPVVAVAGVIEDLSVKPPSISWQEGDEIFVLGGVRCELGGSRWAVGIREHRGGTLPELDLAAHGRLAELVAGLANSGLLSAIHDVSDGGLGVALAEMAIASGIGASVKLEGGWKELFSEAPSRVVCAVSPAKATELASACDAAGVPYYRAGSAGGDRVDIEDLASLSLQAVSDAWHRALPEALEPPSS